MVDALTDPACVRPRLFVVIDGLASRPRGQREVCRLSTSALLVQVEQDQLDGRPYCTVDDLRSAGIDDVRVWRIPADLPYRMADDREIVYSVIGEYMRGAIVDDASVVVRSDLRLGAPRTPGKAQPLARYCRRLVQWSITDELFADWVEPDEIALGGQEPPWRRTLWMDLYPKVRRDESISVAAMKVAKAVREKVMIVPRLPGDRRPIAAVWSEGVATHQEFAVLLAAGLRSVGIPARLNTDGSRAEFWSGFRWLQIPVTALPFQLPCWPESPALEPCTHRESTVDALTSPLTATTFVQPSVKPLLR